MKKYIVLIFCSLICFKNFGQGKAGEDDQETAKSIDAAKNKELYAPRQSTFFSNYSNINISSEFGDNSASALMAFTVGASSAFSFYLKQPFEEKPKKVDFFNQNGLATGTSAEIAFQHAFWKTKVDNGLFQKMKDAYAQKMGIAKGTAAYNTITTGDFSDKDQADFWSKKENRLGMPVLVGFGYAVAKNEIDYIVDSFSTAPQAKNKTNHNIRITIGLLTKKRSLISLSVVKEIKYESGDPISMNFPLNGTGLSFSKEVTLGSPVKKDVTRLQVDYRQSFYKDGVISFAIAPSVAYRTVQKSIVVDVPVYFLNFKEDQKVKGLQGGLSVGYTNKLKEKTTFKDGFALSIFVGVPFDLFGYFKTR